MNHLVAWPVLLPLVTALVVSAFERRWRFANHVALVSAVLLEAVVVWLLALTASGDVLVLSIGGWDAAVGIVWVVDRLSAIMLVLSATSSLATLVHAGSGLRGGERRWFHPLHHLLLMGVNGTFVTGDLFNLFVFFEVMLLSSFVLMALGGRPEQLKETLAYVIVNLVGSALLFCGVGLVYASAGTVNMAALATRVHDSLPAVFWAGLVMVFVVFAVKAALVPFFFWLPDSYPRAPVPVSAYFAGLLTKVGVYTLFRGVTLLAGPYAGPVCDVLLWLSVLTMLWGVMAAFGRSTIRGILSFHIISQVGYMVFGLALFTPTGLAAGLFYVIHHILVKSALFFAGGTVELIAGGGELSRVRGLGGTQPWLAASFLIPALALAGIPPLSGFWGKLLLVIAGVDRGAYVGSAIAVLVSLLTLASMLKIWFAVFWGAPSGAPGEGGPLPKRLFLPPLGLALLSIVVGLGSFWLWPFTLATARSLLVPRAYIDSVLLGDAGARVQPGVDGS